MTTEQHLNSIAQHQKLGNATRKPISQSCFATYYIITKKNVPVGFMVLIICLLIFSSCGILRNMMPSSSYTSVEIKNDSIYYTPIIWSYDSLNNGEVKRNAMYVPVYIETLKQNALMQFDIGSNVSGFYKKTINLLIENLPELQENIKTTEKGREYFKNAKLSLNKGVTLNKDKLYMWQNMGHDSLPESMPIIGTIGYDILDENVLIIDYVNHRIALVSELPAEFEKRMTFIEKADLKKFPVILPFKLGTKKIRLFFDTGSSSAQVLTSTRRLKRLAVNREVVPLDSGYSWGKFEVEYRAREQKLKDARLQIGNICLGQVQVSGLDRFNRLFTLTGRYLYGFTGNVMFENCILAIDRKNNRFGITKIE